MPRRTATGGLLLARRLTDKIYRGRSSRAHLAEAGTTMTKDAIAYLLQLAGTGGKKKGNCHLCGDPWSLGERVPQQEEAWWW